MNRNAKRKFKISLKKEDLDLNKFFQKGHLSFVFTVLFIALVLAAIVFGPVHYSGRIRVGEISLRSIYAPYDFRYPWGVNEKRTKESREELIKSIPDVYDIEGVREEDAVKNFVSLFDALQAAGEIQDKAEKKLVIETLNTETGLDIRDNVLEYFTELKDAKEIKEKLVSVLSSLYPLGIIDPETRKKLIEENLSVRIRNPKIKTERIRPSKELFTPEDAEKVASEYIDRMFPKNSKLRKYSIDLVTPFITHNLVFNEQLTTRIKEEALKNATPIYDMLEIKKNELVIERGQRITKQHIAQLTQLGALGGISRKGPYLSGILFLLIVLIGVGITYLTVTEKKIITSPKNVSIILINCLILIVIS
ncbi:MAG: hypothetical protein HQ579_05030, partial [Candidatus Omnitrophica bacterium]|nr:hypothetical protein [Candidatus Omnitrophota bacterium]